MTRDTYSAPGNPLCGCALGRPAEPSAFERRESVPVTAPIAGRASEGCHLHAVMGVDLPVSAEVSELPGSRPL